MAAKRQRSISCSDDDWAAIQKRAKEKSLSASEYIVALSRSDEADAGGAAKPAFSEVERSAFRAIWFLYVDRLGQMKDAGEQPRIDALVAEARRKFE